MITQNIIGYELSAQSSKQIYAFDPALQIKLPEAFSPATREEIERALEKAHAAWRIFRKIDSKKKALFLSAIADGIENLGETLVKRMMAETGYGEARVLVERRRTCAQLRMYAEIVQQENWLDITINEALPDRTPLPRPDLRKMNVAIGPVIVFAASNFPLAYSTAGGDTTSALAAGCPVIVKAHESHLGTNALVAEVIMNAAKQTGMPDGVFSSLNGDGIETGTQLVLHPLTAAVGFTGSLKGGRALFDIGSSREKPIPVFAEMGSTNPVFLLPNKVAQDAKKISTLLAESITNSSGQFCTKPGILLAIQNEATEVLITFLEESLSKIPSATMLNENIAENFHKGVASVKAAANIMTHGLQTTADTMKGIPLLASVDAEYFLAQPHLHSEVFGPFALMVLCKDPDQMLAVANSLDGQLTATVHATTDEFQFVNELTDILIEKAGRIIFNGVPTGVEVGEAMTHGGPYPASTDSRYTAVGHHAIRRWLRPVTYQNFPNELLPLELIRQDNDYSREHYS
ncbi:MAG TPA: aldehyde dehydrogenase (NADP(+)) [Saprospiraceae bacterium]|nr:aldehyde dehydrogenase (NADP(+)) [Saprospiraceae bacterium]